MKSFKLFWTLHKWTGVILALVFTTMAVTGFLLLIKKRNQWIQPPTVAGADGGLEDVITVQEMFAAVLAAGHPDFTSMDDVDRVDYRPGKNVFKVQSVHNFGEIQIDAVTGAVLHTDVRRSDLFENIHDGSFFGDWVHDWVWPIVPLALLFLVFSGLWLWIEPLVKKKRRRRRTQAARAADHRLER